MSSGRRDDRISGNTDIDRSLVGAMNWVLLGTLHAQCGLENDFIHEVLQKRGICCWPITISSIDRRIACLLPQLLIFLRC